MSTYGKNYLKIRLKGWEDMDSLDLSLIVMMVIGALVIFAPIFIILIGMKYNNREEKDYEQKK